MSLVRLTIFQDPVEVPEDEIPGLRAQGLVVDEPTETAAKAAPKASAPRKDES